jgi:hypothetical protein
MGNQCHSYFVLNKGLALEEQAYCLWSFPHLKIGDMPPFLLAIKSWKERHWTNGLLKGQFLPQCPLSHTFLYRNAPSKWQFAFQSLSRIFAQIQDRYLKNTMTSCDSRKLTGTVQFHPKGNSQSFSERAWSTCRSGTQRPRVQPHPFAVIIFNKTCLKYISIISWL